MIGLRDQIREKALSQKLTLEEELEICQDLDVYSRMNLAKNRFLHPQSKQVLSKDKDANVRASLASRPASSLSVSLKIQLLNDTNSSVRSKMARYPWSEKEQLALAQDKARTVRRVLAQNPALQLKPAIVLYYDEDRITRNLLQEYHSSLFSQIKELEETTRQSGIYHFPKSLSQKKQKLVIKEHLLSK